MSPETEHAFKRVFQLAGIGLLALIIWGALYLVRDRVPSPIQKSQTAIEQVCAAGFKVIDPSGRDRCG
jgi:hypothetical protein